jgi:hypothetical protein
MRREWERELQRLRDSAYRVAFIVEDSTVGIRTVVIGGV